jgi:hypothetical protein
VFGDKAPATIRSTGANGGTTVGRVLRYELESGALGGGIRRARPRDDPDAEEVKVSMVGNAVAIEPAAAVGLVSEALNKRYGGRRVVQDVSVRIAPGEIVGLLGPNGAGKTTSFYLILGLVPADGGRVPPRRPRHHRIPDVPARAGGHRVPARRRPRSSVG